MLEASRLDDIVEQVVRTLSLRCSPSTGSAWPRCVNAFYHRSRFNEEREDLRRWRAPRWRITAALTRVLDLMGVAVQPRM